MLLLLSGHLGDMFLLALSIGLISLLQLLLQLLDFGDEALAILGLHVGVFLQLARGDDELLLELLARPIRLSDHSLVLSQISLQVVEDGLSLLKTYQDTKFIVQLNLLFLEQELEGVVLCLIKVGRRESLGGNGGPEGGVVGGGSRLVALRPGRALREETWPEGAPQVGVL